MKQNVYFIYYIILSTLAVVLLLLVIFIGYSNLNTTKITDKLFVGVTFIVSSFFGISLAKYPGWLRRLTGYGNHNHTKKQTQNITQKHIGHHPKCDKFRSHIIKIKNKTYCAGCLGLEIGSIISIILMLIYIFVISSLSSNLFHLVVFFGIIIIAITYVEIMISIRLAIVHTVSNVFFVVSFLFIVIGVTEITRNGIYGIISVLLSFLWLDTRIQLSKRQHIQICKNCIKSCKMY